MNEYHPFFNEQEFLCRLWIYQLSCIFPGMVNIILFSPCFLLSKAFSPRCSWLFYHSIKVATPQKWGTYLRHDVSQIWSPRLYISMKFWSPHRVLDRLGSIFSLTADLFSNQLQLMLIISTKYIPPFSPSRWSVTTDSIITFVVLWIYIWPQFQYLTRFFSSFYLCFILQRGLYIPEPTYKSFRQSCNLT